MRRLSDKQIVNLIESHGINLTSLLLGAMVRIKHSYGMMMCKRTRKSTLNIGTTLPYNINHILNNTSNMFYTIDRHDTMNALNTLRINFIYIGDELIILEEEHIGITVSRIEDQQTYPGGHVFHILSESNVDNETSPSPDCIKFIHWYRIDRIKMIENDIIEVNFYGQRHSIYIQYIHTSCDKRIQLNCRLFVVDTDCIWYIKHALVDVKHRCLSTRWIQSKPIKKHDLDTTDRIGKRILQSCREKQILSFPIDVFMVRHVDEASPVELVNHMILQCPTLITLEDMLSFSDTDGFLLNDIRDELSLFPRLLYSHTKSSEYSVLLPTETYVRIIDVDISSNEYIFLLTENIQSGIFSIQCREGMCSNGSIVYTETITHQTIYLLYGRLRGGALIIDEQYTLLYDKYGTTIQRNDSSHYEGENMNILYTSYGTVFRVVYTVQDSKITMFMDHTIILEKELQSCDIYDIPTMIIKRLLTLVQVDNIVAITLPYCICLLDARDGSRLHVIHTTYAFQLRLHDIQLRQCRYLCNNYLYTHILDFGAVYNSVGGVIDIDNNVGYSNMWSFQTGNSTVIRRNHVYYNVYENISVKEWLLTMDKQHIWDMYIAKTNQTEKPGYMYTVLTMLIVVCIVIMGICLLYRHKWRTCQDSK